MKIVNHRCEDSAVLHSIDHGAVIQLCEAVHNKHEADDYFIITEVCGSYRPHRTRTNKIKEYASPAVAVTNLRTGALAYLDPERQAITIDCSLELAC